MSIPQELRVDQASYSKTIQLITDSYHQDVPGLDMESYIMNNDNEESYFSDPYENRYSAWMPPIVVDRLIAFPNQLIYAKSDLTQASGLFTEIGYYWLATGNKLYLWSYMKKHDLVLPDDCSQQITHVHLANAMKGVFDDSVTHVLLITTRIEILAYPLSYSKSTGISLRGNVLRQSTNNINILCITSTKSGRIFFGCEDNDIYEFDYRYNSNLLLQLMGYSSHGQVVNRTGYLLQLLIPSFIREISYGNNINKLVVDDDRHILYCLYKRNMIYGYYLGEHDTEFECTLTVSSVHSDLLQYCSISGQRECTSLTTLLSKEDHQGIALVSLSIIPKSVAERISIVATTKSNLRLYYTVNSMNGKSPTSLVLSTVRFPPSHSLPIRSAFQYHSTYFTINEDNSVTAYSRDYLHHLREDIKTYQSRQGDYIPYGQISSMEAIRYQEYCRIVKERGYETVNIYEIEEEVDKMAIPSMILSCLNNGLSLPCLTLQHQYLILTANSIMILKEVSVFDQLIHLLSVDQWENEMKLYFSYINSYEACYNLLVCLTQSKASNLHSRIVHIIMDKSGIPNFGIDHQQGNTMVLYHKETHSHLYEGLIKAISRGLLLLWNEPMVLRNCNDLRYPASFINSLVQYLNQVVSFMQETCHDAVVPGDIINYPGNERKQEELKDLRLLYLMLLRCIQILKLFLYIQDIGLSSIYSLLVPASQNALLSTTFCNLVNSPEGCILIKHLINAILIHYKQNPVAVVYDVCNTLASFCGGYFTLGEKLYNQGIIVLKRILEDSLHINQYELKNAIDSIVISFKYFTSSDVSLHLQDVYSVLTKSGRFLEYVQLAIHVSSILSPENFDTNSLETTKSFIYQSIVNAMKLLMTGRVNQVSISNENRESMMKAIIQECLSSQQKSLCFLVFQWLFDNHLYDIILNIQSDFVEQFLHEKSPDLLHRYFLKNRNYVKAAEVMFISAFKNDNETPIDHRIQYLTSCINNLKAASNGLTSQQSYSFPAMNLNQLIMNQQNMLLQAEVADAVSQMEGKEDEDCKKLQVTVMDAESLYTLAKKYHFDEICLKILRNCNYTDETVILTHWKNIIDRITHSDNYNRMEVVRTKVITLAKEFNTDYSPCFFPLPYLYEIILSAGSLEMRTSSTLYKWFVSCFIQCGVSYEQLAKTGFDLIDLKPTSKWQVMICGVFTETVDEWIDYIVLKNIDPTMKSRFIHSIGLLKEELQTMKNRLITMKDGSISQDIKNCDKHIDEVLKKLSKQQDRERSLIYGNMM